MLSIVDSGHAQALWANGFGQIHRLVGETQSHVCSFIGSDWFKMAFRPTVFNLNGVCNTKANVPLDNKHSIIRKEIKFLLLNFK